jgi:hypothetical protein
LKKVKVKQHIQAHKEKATTFNMYKNNILQQHYIAQMQQNSNIAFNQTLKANIGKFHQSGYTIFNQKIVLQESHSSQKPRQTTIHQC